MTVNNPSLPGALALVGAGLVTLSGAIVFSSLGGAAHANDGSTEPDALEVREGRAVLSAPGASGTGSGADRRAGNVARSAMGVGDGCVDEAALAWFAPPRPLPLCGDNDFPGADGRHADVNGDGFPENFRMAGDPFIVDGQPLPVPIPIATRRVFAIENGEIVSRNRVILRSDAIAGWVLQSTSLRGTVYVTDSHWNDLDGDGDLDLVLVFFGGSGWPPATAAAWLENTGFEATQPLTGDLNSDGHVNSADLALLLGGWTGS